MIASTVPEILFTATRHGSADYLNAHFSKYSGRELSDLVGRGWLDLVHPEERAQMEAELSRNLEGIKEFQASLRLRRADGVYRWFKWHATPVMDASGKVERWFGVCSDVDDEKRLTAALQSRTRELMQLNEGLDRFARAASHDLRAPLRTMRMVIQVFLKTETLDPKTSEMFLLVLKNTEQMLRLVDDVMELATATISAKQGSMPVNTYAVAELAVSNLGQAIKGCAAEVVLEPLPTVFANESAMLRLFQNLIANAIKYRGKNTPQVRICASQQNKEWVFSVKDNGIGIDPQYHDTIFEPFRRLHKQSEYEGSGIGLSACQRIVQSLNGQMWVRSKVGEGSTFFFTIPKHFSCEKESTPRLIMSGRQSSAALG